jgi:outer membrane immunogenic protein
MRTLFRATIALVTLSACGSALAADLAVKAPDRATPPIPVYNWSGFYVGANAGGAWGNFDPTTSTVLAPNGYFCDVCVSPVNAAGIQTIKPATFTGGVQAGVNWQAGSVVFGGEVDFNSFHLNGSASTTALYIPTAPGTLTVTSAAHTDWLLTARGRLGFAANNWLFYATGGLAVTNLEGGFTFSDNGVPPGLEAASLSKTKLGYTVGGGVEAGLWGNWSIKAEYLYVNFSSESVVGFITSVPVAFGAANNPFTHTIDLKANIVRVGLNYRFGGPVVARY